MRHPLSAISIHRAFTVLFVLLTATLFASAPAAPPGIPAIEAEGDGSVEDPGEPDGEGQGDPVAPDDAEESGDVEDPGADEIEEKEIPEPLLTPEQEDALRAADEAVALLGKGEREQAEALMKEALALDPDNVVAHAYLGFLAFRDGNLRGARTSVEAALAANETLPAEVTAALGRVKPLALLILGRVNESEDRFDDASEAYARAGEAGQAGPTAATDGALAIAGHALYLRGLLESSRGNHAEALPDLARAVEIFPSHVHALYEKGRALLALDRPAEAAEAFSACRDERANWMSSEAWLFPINRYLFLDENARFWHGVALARAGQKAEAVEKLTPLLPVVESRLASVVTASDAGRGDPAGLEGTLDLSYYEAHLELARAQHGLGNNGDAQDAIKKYLRIARGDPERVKAAKLLRKELR